jgi:DNA-binding MarR family transcriptional regulator
VPKYTRPANSANAEDPIQAFGNMVRASIIGHLRDSPNGTRAEIARALDISKPTTISAINKLVEQGMLIADPPREAATRGQWVRYRVNDPLVTEMYFQLGQVLREV